MPAGVSYPAVVEVYFLDSGFADLSTTIGGTANDYNTAQSPSLNAPKAFDRNAGTYFAGVNVSSIGAYVGFHFTSAVDVTYVDITTHATIGLLPFQDTLYLETSTDGIEWELSYKLILLSGTWSNSQTCRFTLSTVSNDDSVITIPSGVIVPADLNAIVFDSLRLDNPMGYSHFDVLDSGNYRIYGYAKVFPDNPTKAKIILFDQPSNRVVRQTFSDPITGYFEFSYIRNGMFYAIAQDLTGTYNGEIFTDLQPIGMN
jgi:hypothetical protein